MKKLWQIVNIASLLIALVANFLVGAQVLNLPAISDISDKYASLLTPAGYAFSIWSLIYLLLAVFAVYQARDLFKPRAKNDIPMKLGPYFGLANLFNALWVFTFVNELVGLSVVMLVLLTVSLYIALARLEIATKQDSVKETVFVWWPLMIYTGWVTVASVVNIASWLESLQITVTPLLGHIVLVGLAVGLLMLLITRNVREILLACIWGITAIGVQQMKVSDDQSVAITAFTVASMLFVAVVIHAYVNRHENPLWLKLVK